MLRTIVSFIKLKVYKIYCNLSHILCNKSTHVYMNYDDECSSSSHRNNIVLVYYTWRQV